MIGIARTGKGYTLVELTIVTLILGIVAVVAIPFFSPGNEKRLRLATEQVASAMRFARSEAIRLRQPHGFSLDVANRTIRVFNLDLSNNPPTPNYTVYHPLSKQTYTINFDHSSIAGVNSMVYSGSFRSACSVEYNIYFDSQGTPWCANPATALLSTAQVTLVLDSMEYQVVLDGITGRVSIQ